MKTANTPSMQLAPSSDNFLTEKTFLTQYISIEYTVWYTDLSDLTSFSGEGITVLGVFLHHFLTVIRMQTTHQVTQKQGQNSIVRKTCKKQLHLRRKQCEGIVKKRKTSTPEANKAMIILPRVFYIT